MEAAIGPMGTGEDRKASEVTALDLPPQAGAGRGAGARRAPGALALGEVDLGPLDALERGEVVLLAHVDAVHRAGVDAEAAEEALAVVDLVLRDREAGPFD